MTVRKAGRGGGADRWELLLSVLGTAAVAILLLAGSWVGLTWLLTGVWVWDYEPTDPAPTDPEFGLPGALRSALLVVGGFGGIVALVVAYRRQKHLEADAAGQRERVRLFTERFGAASAQLGAASAVTRLAGVYAMAALADEWVEQQQQCTDVLCAYLRLPYTPQEASTDTPVRTTTTRTSPGPEPVTEEVSSESRPGEREVRWTIIRVIRDHLRGEQPAWAGRDFDFTGATFDGADFTDARFTGGTVTFNWARFAGGSVTFDRARFAGGTVIFADALCGGSRFVWPDGSESAVPPEFGGVLADDAEVGPPDDALFAGPRGGGFGGQVGEGDVDVGPDLADGDAEHALAAADEVDDLLVGGAFVDGGPVGEQGEPGEVCGAVCAQGVQGGADVGQGDSGVEQSFDQAQGEDVAE
jgi:hypothetical protein